MSSNSEIDFSTVIASTVHDMKNSLGMLLHCVDEVRDSVPAEVQESSGFTTLQYEAQRVHGNLIQLLGLYRLQQSTLSAAIDEHFVPDFMEVQLARHQPLLQGLGLKIALEAEPVSGFFDQHLVAGILDNTVNNAIRYTRGQLRLTASEEDGYLVFTVEDDGGGYPEQMREATEYGLGSINFSTGSTHLGLYFADRIARLHRAGDRQGFIRLRNGGQLGGGIFELWLP